MALIYVKAISALVGCIWALCAQCYILIIGWVILSVAGVKRRVNLDTFASSYGSVCSNLIVILNCIKKGCSTVPDLFCGQDLAPTQ